MGARDIGGHQVRRKLNPAEFTPQHMGQGTYEQCFGHAGDPFDEGMMAGENGDQSAVDHLVLADDDFGDLFFGAHEDVFQIVGHSPFPCWSSSQILR